MVLTTQDRTSITTEAGSSAASSIVPTMLDVAPFDGIMLVSPFYLTWRIWRNRRWLADTDEEDVPAPRLAITALILLLLGISAWQLLRPLGLLGS